MTAADPLISWLLEGDPAIRWQTLRHLQHASAHTWQAEQRLTLEAGWGARYLALQAPDATWGGGIYSPKWTSTTYTLLTLIAIGLPGDHPPAQRAAELVLSRLLGSRRDEAFLRSLAAMDRCVVGMCLSIAVYFGLHDARLEAIVENLLAERMPDHAWNCRRLRRPKPHHSSFHTTFNVLDGLRLWLETTPQHPLREAVLEAETSALEFVLQHHLFKSDKTGNIIHHNFTLLSYPHRWYYNVLRGLEYFARANAARDARLQDAIDLLLRRQLADGAWPVQHKYPARSFFDMEKTGGPSRWNTLRALRVLHWWEK